MRWITMVLVAMMLACGGSDVAGTVTPPPDPTPIEQPVTCATLSAHELRIQDIGKQSLDAAAMLKEFNAFMTDCQKMGFTELTCAKVVQVELSFCLNYACFVVEGLPFPMTGLDVPEYTCWWPKQ